MLSLSCVSTGPVQVSTKPQAATVLTGKFLLGQRRALGAVTERGDELCRSTLQASQSGGVSCSPETPRAGGRAGCER